MPQTQNGRPARKKIPPGVPTGTPAQSKAWIDGISDKPILPQGKNQIPSGMTQD